MSDHILVPVEPTPEMVEAAQEAYMPFGDMDIALRMALLEAPAMQGEPVAFCEDAALSIAERTFSTDVDEQLASDIIQYAQRLHSLYAAPQPAEQQPDVTQLVEALETIQKVATHKSIHTDTQAEIALGGIAVICATTLAAYRKQGGEA